MNNNSTSSEHDELVFAQFVADLEASTDPAAIAAEYSVKYPHFARRLRQMAALNGDLSARRKRPSEALPARLGDFRIVRKLAVGGMGTVYEALQEPLNRRVAVKTIRSDCPKPQERARFLREQAVLASFHQTHIVPIHTAGQVGDLQYFAMPYIEGMTVAHIIKSVWQQSRTSPGAKTPNLATLAMQTRSSTVLVASEDTDVTARPAEAGPALTPVTLSSVYFRSVAKVLADVADAFEYVHGLNILHRDLKPSNLMVDSAGQCWIIDFGLAAYLQEADRSTPDPEAASPDNRRTLFASSLTAGNIIGTPSYMAPEQWRGEKIDRRTDVWGLGATLYEMLTLRQAFPGEPDHDLRREILLEEPTPPRQLAKGLPLDLEAVCLRALRKEPARRYQSAGEFAADLRRWLNQEPVTARRTRLPRRIGLWVRRNRAWSAAIAAFVIACAALAFGEIRSARAREREQRREGLLEQVQNVRLLPHQVTQREDWFEDGWSKVRQAVQLGNGSDVQDQAAALLGGVNASLAKSMLGFRSSSIAIDAEGRRVLIGGTPHDEAKIWDPRTDVLQPSGLRGAGPVVFSRDKSPWQLVPDPNDRFTLVLWDMANRRIVRNLKIPQPAKTSAGPPNDLEIAFADDGAFAAATAPFSDRSALVTVWETASGKVVRQMAQTGRELTSVAVSPDGSFVATGDSNGKVSVWPLPSGEPFPLPSTGRTEVDSLAFGPNLSGKSSADKAAHWFVAGGDAAGKTTIWDLGRRVPITQCRGSYYNVSALAFSPDGVTLATTGRAESKLWDIATGRMLLDLHFSDYMTGIAFSRDAGRLAISMERNQHPPELPHEGIQVWDLEYHRGVQTLRGLDGQIAHSKVCFADDARRIAALSADWRIAIWELPTGFLHRVFEISPSSTADNGGLAFSHDGRKFACSSGDEAKLWDLESSRTTTWRLPPGLGNTLVFDSTDTHLWLFRVETADGAHPPDSRSPLSQYPRVCRVRDLLATGEHDLREVAKHKPTWETREFDAGDVQSQATRDGKRIVAVGTHGIQKRERFTKLFDSASGKELLSLPSNDFGLESSGEFLAVYLRSDVDGACQLVKLPGGELVDSIAGPFHAIGPGARLLAARTANGFGYSLRRRDAATPLVTLGVDTLAEEGRPTFDRDGALLAWGNRDGTVTVCHLEEVQRRLAALGLGW